jgi:hypothetical protein
MEELSCLVSEVDLYKSLTVFICNANIFLLSVELPQKIIHYLIEERK